MLQALHVGVVAAAELLHSACCWLPCAADTYDGCLPLTKKCAMKTVHVAGVSAHSAMGLLLKAQPKRLWSEMDFMEALLFGQMHG